MNWEESTPSAGSDLIDTVHGKIKIVDIRKITEKPAIVKAKKKPHTKHRCRRCKASFDSAHALSVHNLLHAKVRVKRMGISAASIKLVLSDPRIYSIRRLNGQLMVIKKTLTIVAPVEKPKMQVSYPGIFSYLRCCSGFHNNQSMFLCFHADSMRVMSIYSDIREESHLSHELST